MLRRSPAERGDGEVALARTATMNGRLATCFVQPAPAGAAAVAVTRTPGRVTDTPEEITVPGDTVAEVMASASWTKCRPPPTRAAPRA